MIQDTSFIVDILRGDDEALVVLDVLERESRPQKVSAITALELYEGVARSDASEAKQEEIFRVLESKHVLDADHTVMRKAGLLSGRLIRGGRRIDREDCVIAATALLEDEPVLTRNRKHFERIDGLDVEGY
ncbi:type II toxin-antitoxin system VapC family toxin [Halobium palmae]|uniref:Ribonuclease VapC n=1 Tax=Halobium palmae TaxID=1776492 RepID=A0ABD5RVJ0_9EURY